MKNMILLFVIRWRLLINEFKGKVSKVSYLLIIFIMFFLGGYGYLLSYSIQLSNSYINAVNWENTIRGFFFLITIMIIVRKIYSSSRFISPLNLRKLSYYPINIITVLFVDLILGLIDLSYLLILSLALGILAGLYGSIIYGFTVIIAFIYIVFIIILIHLFSELVTSLVRLFNNFSKSIFVFTSILISLTFFYVFINYNNMLNNIFEYFFAQTIGLFNLYLFDDGATQIYNVIFNNFILLLIFVVFYFIFKYADVYLSSKHYNFLNLSQTKQTKKCTGFYNILKMNNMFYFEKEFKYLWRNRNTLLAVLGELLVYAFIFYKFSNNYHANNIFFAMFIGTSIPLFMWDSYLSNQWGTEKSGFGVYLFSNVSFKNIVLSKNSNFFIIRFIFTIFSCGFYGFIFSFDIIPFVIFLQIIIPLLLINFSNINSIRNPNPVDLNENAFSQNQSVSLSFYGLVGLLISFIVPILLLIVLWKYKYELITYLIFITVLLLLISIYIISLKKIEKLLIINKEIIFIKLVNL